MKVSLAIAAVLLVIAGAVYAKVSVWTECRATNSWLYCMHVISR